jgi:hypothetical protein
MPPHLTSRSNGSGILHFGEQVVGAGQQFRAIAMVAIFFPRRFAMAA